MGICQQVAEAAGGLRQGLQSPVGNGLLNVLNAIGAADIGLRLGTGNQIGSADLPGLFTTPGIPCYSPELGDTIYVTPTQWYANGMSCDGLRDANREELESRIERLQEAAETRNQIRRNFDVDLPPMEGGIEDTLNRELTRSGAYFNNGFGGSAGGSLQFLFPGTLSVAQSYGSVLVSMGGWVTESWQARSFTNTFLNPFPEIPQANIEILPGDTIAPQISSWIDPNNPVNRATTTIWSLRRNDRSIFFVEDRRVATGKDWIGNDLPSGHYISQSVNVTGNRAKLNFQVNLGGGAPGSGGGTPGSGGRPPDDNNGHTPSYPINPTPEPEPPEEPCMGGCSCGQMANQQARQNQNLERLIKEIHKAIGAEKFASGAYSFKPEQLIESQGKTIYAQNPGRGGQVGVTNLLEAISAAISAHYHRSGLHRFPAKVPDSLIPNSNDALEAIDRDEITLYDAMAWQKWFFEQWEAATGEYPIKYEVTDDGKSKPVRLWNQSEILAEMFGMMCKIQEDADLGVQWGVRAATEASKSGNAALKGLHLLQEYVKWSGCLTSNGEKDFIKVKSTFSPDPSADPTKAEEMLKPSTQDLQVTNIVDGRSLLGVLMNINYWAQISGRANFGDMGAANPLVQSPGQNMNMPGDGIKEMRKKERAQNKAWDKWKQQQEAASTIPQAQQPPGGIPTANIIEIDLKKT